MRTLLAIAASLAVLCLGCAHPTRTATTSNDVWYYFQGRSDGLQAIHQRMEDKEHGGGTFLLTDPQITNMSAVHINQPALGGSNMFGLTGTVTVDPQTGAIISATGTAVGNVVGAAAKTFVKP